ncbi:SUMO ligase CST9 NDAI_0J02290 [Naumovozyma dairenensis CBS 421]|uniref:RING-type domain-containing protein n=1 Tax=Naumovozyma dairenensis (strain ATCC 10597 / BCRC 20456 / CBS 421 / NBRC 0211 / NRRL Y-12639) TaxID=1071378 RepID=G0WH43_NAUDC|nr:hypothetical protein NDAI_0J02290 [Naumovozyma dairenensis CBS 421]CCD27121.1 hypothetical protein NDAI_0J02290 [Naumovozyma dairenensis CBS 421]
MSSNSLFDQPFVYCAICHRRSAKEDPLGLTSCAHILCSQHLSPSKICPACNTNDISIIRLVDNKTLPNDVKIFFEPIPQALESLYNVSQFQISGLRKQCQYYQNHCVKLREKCARQQQLLYKAKQELDSIPPLKKQITELENIIKRQEENMSRTKNQNYLIGNGRRNNNNNMYTFPSCSSTSSSMGNHPPPPTIDLTLDYDDGGSESDINNIEQTFINKLKKTSSLRKNLQQNRNNSNNNSGIMMTSSKNIPIVAESTQYSPMVQEKDLHIALSSSSNEAISSGHSSSNLTFNLNSNLNSSKFLPTSHTTTVTSALLGNKNNENKNSNNNKMMKPINKRKQFPNALENLRIVKRNNTIGASNRPTRSILNSQGIITHMKSSDGLSSTRNRQESKTQEQENVATNRPNNANILRQRASSQQLFTKNNSKFRRIR